MSLADHQQGRAAKLEGTYPLTVGREYIIFGMLVAEGVFGFLIRDDWDIPSFAPAGMFELLSGPLPEDWGFSLRPGIRLSGDIVGEDPIVAAFGYQEMIADPEHIYKLLEQDDEALDIFTRHVLGVRPRSNPDEIE